MSLTWDYPIYLIPHGTGYVSLVDKNAPQAGHLLVVYTQPSDAEVFMQQFEIVGAARALSNAREFRWLLTSLQAPVTQVVFDPAPTDDEVHPAWQVSVEELLERHLVADNSPWNYPVFAIAQDSGYACIEGSGSRGEALRAVGIFSSEQRANDYLRAADQKGTVLTLSDMDMTTSFLTALAPEVAAAAIDPTVADGNHSAEHCFLLETLLVKYLVRDTRR